MWDFKPITPEVRRKLKLLGADQTIARQSPKPSTASDREKLKRVEEARRILEEGATFPKPLDIQPE
jgi:hypothetical protein